MSDFFRSSAASSTSQPDASVQMEQIKTRLRGEIALQNAQELMNKMNEKCFSKCIPKPSSSLSNSEQTCLSRCMERYMEAYNVVSATYHARLSKERAAQNQASLDGAPPTGFS